MFLLLMIGHYHYVFCVFVIVVLRVMYNYINVSSSWENYVMVITTLYYRASDIMMYHIYVIRHMKVPI